jgi:hypothetical protein
MHRPFIGMIVVLSGIKTKLVYSGNDCPIVLQKSGGIMKWVT